MEVLVKKPIIVALLILLLSPLYATAQFTFGNLVVLQTGDGSAALSSVGTQVMLKEFNTTTANQTTPTDSVIMPTTGTARLVTSGSATSEGQISLSADSTKIVVVGYDAATGTTGVASSATLTINRVIDTVNLYNGVGRATSTATQFTGNNIRSACRGSNDDYWGAGGNSGTYYMGNTATADSVQFTSTNNRVIKTFRDTIYVSSGSGTRGIYKIYSTSTGLPKSRTSVTTTNFIPTGSASSPYSFAFNTTTGTTVYIADDNSVAAGGGVQRWTYNGTSWAVADTLPVGGASSVGARGLVGDFTGTYPVLYATTTDNRLIKIIDSGTITSTYTTLATAPTNTAFRSVCFSPKCVAPTTLNTVVTNPLCNGANTGAVSLTVVGGTTVATYAWTGPSSFTSASQNLSSLAAGTYNLTVTTIGGCQATKTVSVTAPTAITTSIASNSPLCIGDSLKLSSSPAGGTGSLILAWTGPSFSASIANPKIANVTAANAGKYKLTVTDANSCTQTDSVAITVNGSLVVNIGNDTDACPGSSVTLDAKNSGATYLWNTGATTQTISITTAGTYYVKVTNTSGCIGRDTLVFALDTIPKVSLGNDTDACPGSSVTLNAKNTGATYLWSTGATTQTINISTAGTYNVKVTSNKGCIGRDTLVYTLDTIPVVSLGNDTTVCGSGGLVLNAKNTGATYLWSTGATTQTLGITAAGTYSVQVSSNKGCKGYDTIAVNTFALPSADGILLNQVGGGEYILSVKNPLNTTSYTWIFGDGKTATGMFQHYYYTKTGNYTLKVILTNACGNDTLSIAVHPTLDVAGLNNPNTAVNVYPNPVNNDLFISTTTEENKAVIISNVLGQAVYTANSSDKLVHINTSALKSGVYFINVRTESGNNYSFRIIKN